MSYVIAVLNKVKVRDTKVSLPYVCIYTTSCILVDYNSYVVKMEVGLFCSIAQIGERSEGERILVGCGNPYDVLAKDIQEPIYPYAIVPDALVERKDKIHTIIIDEEDATLVESVSN